MKEETIQISQHAFEALVRQVGRGGSSNPNPDDPDEPVGPWGPVIHALLQARYVANPEPSPWRLAQLLAEALAGRRGSVAQGPHPEPWIQAALNPQPLPPRVVLVAILTEEVIRRATSLFDLAAALPGHARERAVAGAAAEVGRYASDYDDDLCPPWRRWPHPPRHDDLTARLDPSERAVMVAQFHAAARGAADPRLGEVFNAAAAQLKGADVPSGVSYEDATLVT